MPIALLALTLSAFAIGTTEFVIVGLLPTVAADLSISIPSAGLLVSLYALGVAIGAPVLTALTGKLPRKTLLLSLMALFTAGNLLAWQAPSYETLVAARILTGLAHGVFFSIGSTIATGLVPRDKAASAIAIMFTGLTIALVTGVPLGTFIGQHFGWRETFLAVSALGVLAFIGSAIFVPRNMAHTPPASLRQQAKVLAHRVCAFAYAFKNQMRLTDGRADLAKFLPAVDAERIACARYPGAMALQLSQEWVGEQMRSGAMQPVVAPAFEHAIARLGNALGGCERIASTPIPFTYSVILHRCIYIYCFLLPFGLVDMIGSMTPVIVCFLAYTFFALEALGAELEHPFGTAANDLALGSLCHTIESSLLEMVGEVPRTDKPEAKDFILL